MREIVCRVVISISFSCSLTFCGVAHGGTFLVTIVLVLDIEITLVAVWDQIINYISIGFHPCVTYPREHRILKKATPKSSTTSCLCSVSFLYNSPLPILLYRKFHGHIDVFLEKPPPKEKIISTPRIYKCQFKKIVIVQKNEHLSNFFQILSSYTTCK